MDRWSVPYNARRTTKLSYYRKKGVYVIRDKVSKEIVYVGMSKSCVYKAMYRHFQSWNDPRHYRVTYVDRTGYEVRLIELDTAWVDYVERRLIRFLCPRDNRERYSESDVQFPGSATYEYVEEVVEECPF